MGRCIDCTYCRMRHEGEYPKPIYRCRHPERSQQGTIDLVSGRTRYPGIDNKQYLPCKNRDGKCDLYNPCTSLGERFWSRLRKLLA